MAPEPMNGCAALHRVIDHVKEISKLEYVAKNELGGGTASWMKLSGVTPLDNVLAPLLT